MFKKIYIAGPLFNTHEKRYLENIAIELDEPVWLNEKVEEVDDESLGLGCKNKIKITYLTELIGIIKIKIL